MYQKLQIYRGMTLVELIVSVSIFSVIIAITFASIYQLYQVHGYTIAQAQEVDYARKGVKLMTRDVREMIYADDGAYPLVIKDANTIGFYSDVDRDDSVEYVEYTLIGAGSTTLQKQVFNATGSPPTYNFNTADETYILSEYVQNATFGTTTFAYYDSDGTLLADSALVVDVRYVRMNVIVNVDPVRNPGQYVLRTSAAIRNLKDNL